MKCENCGKYEATCHYTSNINGNVSEQHLCSRCAGETGWASDMLSGVGRAFGGMLDGMFGGFFDAPRRVLTPWGFGFAVPALTALRAAAGTLEREAAPSEAEASAAEAKPAAPAADTEMAKRREINVLREQMRAAAEAEDFEKAAEIRDKLRELEK